MPKQNTGSTPKRSGVKEKVEKFNLSRSIAEACIAREKRKGTYIGQFNANGKRRMVH